MSVTKVAQASTVPGVVTSFAVTLPTGYTTGDRLILFVGGKDNTAGTPTINQSWVLIGSGTGGTGTNAADTGTTFWRVFAKDATSASETAPTVTSAGTAPNSWVAWCAAYRPDSGNVWIDPIITSAPWVSAATDASTATPLTGTATAFSSQPTAGDAIAAFGITPTDSGTALGTTTITATGLSSGTVDSASGNVVNALNNDVGAVMASWTGFTGTATAGVAMSFTITSSTNLSGNVVAVQLRQATPGTRRWHGNAVSDGTALSGGNINTAGNGSTVTYSVSGTATNVYAGDGFSVVGVTADISRIDENFSPVKAIVCQVLYTPTSYPTAGIDRPIDIYTKGGVRVAEVQQQIVGAGALVVTGGATCPVALTLNNRYQIDLIVALNDAPTTSNGRLVIRVKNRDNSSWNTTGEWFYDSGYTLNLGLVDPAQVQMGKCGGGTFASANKFEMLSWDPTKRVLMTDLLRTAIEPYMLADPPVTQTTTPGGVATAEAHGSPTVTVTAGALTPTGIATAEAHGSPVISPVIATTPTGVASSEAFGSPVISTVVATSPSGIATAEALGSPVINTIVSLSPTGIASAEAHGSPVLNVPINASPTGIATAQAFGTPVITGIIALTPSGITTAEAEGSPSVSYLTSIFPTGIATSEAHGSPTINTSVSVIPTGVASAQAFGTPVITSVIALIPTGVTSSETHGSPTVNTVVAVSPTGVASGQAFGSPVLAMIVNTIPTGIASAEAHGSPSLSTIVALTPNGVLSGEAFTNPAITTIIAVTPDGIVSAEAFTNPTVTFGAFLTPTGIAAPINSIGAIPVTVPFNLGDTGQPVGSPTLLVSQMLAPTGVASAQAVGSPVLAVPINTSPTGIATSQALGTPVVNTFITLTPTGVVSTEAHGSPTLSMIVSLSPTGIATAAILGTPSLTAVVSVTPTPVTSLEAFGAPVVAPRVIVTPVGIASLEAVGTPAATQARVLTPSGVVSGEAFGTPIIVIFAPGPAFEGWGIPL